MKVILWFVVFIPGCVSVQMTAEEQREWDRCEVLTASAHNSSLYRQIKLMEACLNGGMGK